MPKERRLFFGVIVDYGVVAGDRVPIRFFGYSIPFFFGAFVVYGCKAGAMGERTIANACYAIGNRYACKSFTAPERIPSNACYAIWNGYA